jgi:hypothetical protein
VRVLPGGSVQFVLEFVAGSCDARSDGPDRNAEVYGGVGIGVTEYLGEDECIAPFGRELSHECGDVVMRRGMVQRLRVSSEDCVEESSATGGSNRVRADASCDGEQPRLGGCVSLVAMEGSQRSGVGLLDEVVGFVAAPDVGAVSPDIGLGVAYERGERYTVAGQRGADQLLVGSHRAER